jgi:DNA-binding CsgD family transcriptional regulator
VLTPSGRVEHAGAAAQSRDVRARLRAAVRDLDRARAQLRRRDPPRAVEIWKGLVSARWSLVEQFESDGRRYLLARRNDSQVGGIDALSDRERQVVGFAALGHTNKLIAYELGIAAGTVGALLHRAARKLGARSRPETIQIFLAHVARFDRST